MSLLDTLRGRLFAFLLMLAGMTAVGVGGGTWLSVRAEADGLFDYQLQQMALSLRDQGGVTDAESAALSNPDLDYLVQVWSVEGLSLYSSRRPGVTEALPPRAVLGFSDQRIGDEDWRVYGAATPLRVIQVAQPLSVRRRLATSAALRSMLPIALAAPLAAGLMWWLIGVSLAPLQRVVQAARSRDAASLDALPTTGLPGELQPLVGAFNGLLARLSTAFEQQRTFVADAAHELRTPLTALKLQLGLLQGAAPGPEHDAAVQRLGAGIDRAAHLVEQLLALARAEPGAASAPMQPVDLADIARLAHADAALLAERRGVVIHCEAEQPVPMQGDAAALRSAIRNLLDNAARYGARTVRLRVTTESGQPLLQVDDDGPGIPPELRERVFDRFQRGEAQTGQVDGSGLGLAIVQAVARRHGARVGLGVSEMGGVRVEMGCG
ncbi:ATP-binding protein [Leptothrix discophora]|uniref:histidine kinase n=1 Tax=Leptothrix discophora TaxID=89 RepID=A0ABT9G0L3_LEPDI|nr:ATP-binding protein [Leptothrix discophora]MDP4300024.1 ATP-binding protein [Leptothrix discophora]